LAITLRALSALVLALLLVTGTAEASYKGTPGQVAYLLGDDEGWPLKLWDPVGEGSTTIAPTTWSSDNVGIGTDVHGFPHQAGPGDLPSTPSWAPDGSKFAFAKRIADNGDYAGLEHAAIFVYEVATGETRQVTHPEDAVLDKVPEDPPVVGHVVSDFAPAFSPDGTTIAFVRHVQGHGPDDTLWDKRGQNLWRVAQNGGTPVQVTTLLPETGQRIWSGVWIKGTTDLVVSYLGGAGLTPSLGRVSSIAGNPTSLVSTATQVITDYDVSPDGTKLLYATLDAGGVAAHIKPFGGGATVDAGGGFGAVVRFANTGDGLLHSDCTERTPSLCGLLNRLTPDSGADIQSEEPDRLALAFDEAVPGNGGAPARSGLDVQPQELPVIFLPGFLGSRITCGAKEEWPRLPFPDLTPMSLNADGATDVGACRPTAVLETALGSDVYETVANYVRSEYGARGTLFGWDWRKRPQPQFTKLEEAIDTALDRPGPWKQQKAGRVVLWGHSYGGLFIRAFIEGSGGDRVARVLTAGTPYWGSPKSFFPLAFGVESPAWSTLDAIINNKRLKDFAKNLSGLYNLYPSARFPAWLTLGGALQNQAGVGAFIGVIGGNKALFDQASADHQNVFDGFSDNGGRIDVRAVVGTGLNTIRSVSVAYDDAGRFEDVSGAFDNGDETVPGRSAAQGPVGAGSPLGDPIHVQYTCNISHVDLAGAAPVLSAYGEFLKTGEVPRKLPGPCASVGGSYRFAPGSIGRADPALRVAGAKDLDTAEAEGLVDVMDLGPATLVVVDDDHKVTLRVPITNGRFSYTPLSGAAQGAVSTYGPATGTLELAPGAAGGLPVVLLNGKPLAPTNPPAGPPPAGPGPPGPPAGSPGSSGAPKPPARFKLVGRPKVRGRVVTLVLRLPGRGAVSVRATAKRRVLGTLRKSIPAARRRMLKLKLKRKVPARLQLSIAFTPAGGAKQTKRVTVKRR
jgi:hypothetical protein